MKSNALVQNSVFRTRLIVNCGLLIALSIVLKIVFEVYIPIGGLPTLRVNLTSIPIMISGILFGPLAGFSVGVISDLLCFAIKPGGPFFPGFTLASGLTGMIPGLIRILLRKKPDLHIEWFNLIATASAILILTALGSFSWSNNTITFNGQAIHPAALILLIILASAFVLYPFICKKYIKNRYIDEKLLFSVTLTQIICSIILNTVFLIMLYGQAASVLVPARIITNCFLIPLYTIAIGGILRLLPKSLKRYC